MSPWVEVEDPDDEFARLREWNGRRADRRYWVEVNGETAMALDHTRLIIRKVDKQGKVVAGGPESGVVPESMKVRRAIDLAVRARSRSVLARGAEGREAAASEGEEDVRGVEFGGTAEELVEVVVDRVIDALRSSNPAVPGDVEFGPADGSEPPCPPVEGDATVPEVGLQEHEGVPAEAVVDAAGEGVDPGPGVDDGVMPVDGQPLHDASPSVGAPCGAGCGTPTVGAEVGGALDFFADASPTGPGLTRDQADHLLSLHRAAVHPFEEGPMSGRVWGESYLAGQDFTAALEAMVTP